ncbi:hypothetical protein [Leucobacter musarum]|uniref:hypothetical protein n=1 Tax=Leucobacter musarum TaxID=1930747 RepID=UPI000A567080|nr:hypothetical protein [Leucobacter musarum]
MSKGRFATRVAFVAAVGVIGIGVTSCMSERPIVSNGDPISIMTREESQLWVADQFDDVVRASGVERGWMDLYEPDFEWRFERDADMQSMIGVWTPQYCGDSMRRIVEGLQNSTAPDPLLAAAKVRAHWEANGWTVSDVRSTPSEAEPEFRADRDDGALLGFSVNENRMSVEVISPCSVHRSLVHRKHSDEQTSDDEASTGDESATTE